MADRTSSGDKDRGRSRSGIPHARRTQRVPQTPRVPGTSHVWMLADDRPGNVNQALGLAEALGEPFEVKTVGYSQLARLPNWLLPANLAGLTRVSQKTLKPPWPDLVIGAGRRTARIGRWLKRQHPGLCLVQLMWPGSSTGFDLIAVPEHDRVPDDPVLLRTLGPPHRLTPERLRRSAEEIEAQLSGMPRPYVTCLVGGSSKHVAFTADDARSLIAGAKALATAQGGSLLVTTSRRTGKACTAAIALALAEAPSLPHWLHRWQRDGDNPYLGMLGASDAVVVSADSASMCTEACAVGRPVFMHEPEAGTPRKFALLHERLRDHGCLRPLGSGWFEVGVPPSNAAFAIADAIKALLARQSDASDGEQVA